MKKILLTILILMNIFFIYGQNNKKVIWTKSEKTQYKTLLKLANYVHGKNKKEISNEILFNKYVHLNYILTDTDSKRKEDRIAKFDTIFNYFKNNFNDIGISNFDAKPVRFYKNHKIYEPFDENFAMETVEGDKLFKKSDNVFAYFKKNDPENPIGVLLFDPNTNKLASWVLIDQGGYRYFLLFNLL